LGLINGLVKPFDRYLEAQIDWKNRLIAIKGSRGVGKTTLMLKSIKEKFKNNTQCLYASLDNLYFSTHSLLELADSFYKQGGKYLFLDEVHKYKNWSQEIKNIYDSYINLKIIFTSSSILEILKGNADLSRRVVIYNLDGLSFREFLQIETGNLFDVYDLPDLLKNHISITSKITKQIKPLAYWSKYLKHGYYPFYLDDLNTYHHRLANTINLILEADLPQCRNVDINYIPKLKKLLYMVAVSPPMQPNISKLSGIIEAHMHIGL
jgi:predicted AAA+ superfamily ATPase